MRRSLSLVALGLSLSVLGVSAASAQQPPVPVPEVLTPWVPWVLADAPLYGCTLATAATDSDRTRDPICVWPGELRIEVGEGGATFTLLGSSDRRHAFALPGSERIQPVDVRLDGRPAVVLTEGGQSLVWVDAGEHRIEGRFSWTTPPETLSVPSEVARVLLVEDGVSSVANRGTNGEVWLRARESETLGEDRVTLEVHRRLDDGSPVTLTTRIVVRAAGRARELALGDILPDGAVPIEVTADLPVRLMASGELSLQLRAGEFTVMVTALVANPETTYRRPALELPWPAQEVWVWVPNESFRQVEISGADGIDPARTSLPDDWRSYSAYLVGSESTFTLSTTRRGEPTPPPNELEVSRTAWLDVNGTGYSVQDHVSFQMHSAHRLELSEGTLGRVSLAGSDQLITLATEDGRPGVELRATQSALTAEWRVESGHASLPAVGWSEDAQSSTTTLNLPPGWELIHAGSVDRAPGTWVERWTLLGFFALLLITAAVGRVLGWQAGAVAFVGVGLALHIDEAPRWIWLTLAVFLAVHRALDGRRFERWLRWGYLAVMVAAVVMVVLFAGSEVKNALYPQLAPAQGYASSAGGEVWDLDERESGGSGADSFAPAAVAPSEAPAAEIEFRSEEHSRSRGIDDLLGGSGSSSPSGRMDYGSNSMWLDPSAVVQTGFGVPTWSWSSYTLAFDGPVSREHRIDLMLSPPWLTRLVALLRAVLALALLALVVRLRPQAPSTPSDEGAPNAPESPVSEASPTPATVGAVAAVAVLLMLGASAWATPARAQTPSPELLGELRTRLTQPPPCERCADANRLTIRIEGDTLIAELEVSAAANASYPLPGPSGTWAPSLVTLDGRATNAVVRLPSGFLHARVPEGVHVLRMEGPLAGRDAITLAFGRVPRTLSVSAEGWEVDGLSAETSAPESIQLRRLLVTQPGADAAIRADLPTWLEIERRLDIGVRWTLTSTVRRRSPANAPAVARIPLLPGESVTDSRVTVEGGLVLVTLGQNATELSWTSTLEPAETVSLAAPREGRLSEVWILACSALWHCESAGLSATESASGTSWEPRFQPWPGETLVLTMTRPGAAPGQSITVDRAMLTVRPGVRLSSSTLELSVRTSVSTSLRLTVPSATDVRALTVDQVTRPLQREGDEVVIALQPGSHTVVLTWQESRGWDTAYETPRITLDHTVVNAELIVEGGADRWFLWVSGSGWGPAVLFWPYLALVLVLAFGLSRRRDLPPRPHDWALLLVGLTQIHPVGALFVVGWFFVLESRKSTDVASPAWFALRQLFIIGYTLMTFGLMVWAVQAGLLGDPQMSIQGPECWDQHLRFFVDRSEGELPTATLLTLPVWVFRALMFVWALWLAVSLVKWARWGWGSFKDGGLFRPEGAPPRHRHFGHAHRAAGIPAPPTAMPEAQTSLPTTDGPAAESVPSPSETLAEGPAAATSAAVDAPPEESAPSEASPTQGEPFRDRSPDDEEPTR
ncbi:MAG: hypothetical protein IPI43_10940 [Sandaracinaceae bacterium]|nr:hypothetical protein [Sandaracinaceae bacterium]